MVGDNAFVLDPEIAAHYELGMEDARLRPGGRLRLEYIRTLELLERILPPAPARVLDVGGGTGVYAVPLCERGYTVHLVDAMPSHVERALAVASDRELAGLTAAVGDARSLTDVGTDYDAVLLLGPLYHLTERVDRVRALAEARRVARPGAVVAAVGISRYASLLDGLERRILTDPVFRSIVERDLVDGQHRNPEGERHPEYFTTAYFHLPDELAAEAVDAGLVDVELYSVEGPGWIVESIDDLEGQLFAARVTEREPALMAATSHILMTGRVGGLPDVAGTDLARDR